LIFPGSDQADLHQQKNDPQGKDHAMHMNQGTGQWRIDHSTAEIAGPEANQHRRQHEHGHAAEKEAIQLASALRMRSKLSGG
jgi:hypothetical protein